MTERDRILTHLDGDYDEPVRDPLWKHVYLTRELKNITESKPFVKLSRILQLGPACIVYPGATHTRFSHSLGVFHVAKRLLRALMYRDPPSFVSLSGVKSFLCAALLHDQGHFPYAHSLKELPLEDHEALTARSMLSEPLAALIRATGADQTMSAGIVDTSLALDLKTDSGKETAFFRGLLSGVLDPDKLDYLNRDAYFSGVSYGVQDIDFIFSRVFPVADRGVGIDSKGIPAVESILFSKYLMYRSVYWHRDVRAATAMMKKAVIRALKEKSILSETLYGLDDASFAQAMEKTGLECRSLVSRVFGRKLYQTVLEIPFDDTNAVHRGYENLDARDAEETGLTERLRSSGVLEAVDFAIIDVPEPISFESDLPVVDIGVPFSASSTAFTEDVVKAFKRELRIIRIFAPESVSVRAIVDAGFRGGEAGVSNR